MSSKKKWICNGKSKNPQYQGYEHDPITNYGNICIECGLPREAVVTKGAGSSSSSRSTSTATNVTKKSPIGFVFLLTPLLLAILGFAAYSFIIKPIISGSSTGDKINLCELQEPEQNPELFSTGERTLFPDRRNPDKNIGIQQFLNQNYTAAQTYFDQATEAARNDPESWIFKNNAKAREFGCPMTIALVVPITNKQTSAEEMMRGVADAQQQFNNNNDIKRDRLLQILIINDGNEPTIAKKVARYIADNPAIIAVIGHNSSNATDAALPIYEKANISVISPTSTSNALRSSVFFRTVPSDATTAQVLGEHAQNELNSQQLVVFYDDSSLYSRSLLDELQNSLSSAQIVKTVKMNSNKLDLAAEVEQSINSGIDTAILFPSTQNTAIAIRVARENNRFSPKDQMQLLGGDALYNPYTLINGGEAVENMIVAVPLATSPSYEDIVAHWGGKVNWRSTASFDATNAIIQAINDLNSSDKINRQDILKQLPLITVSSAAASWQFEHGERNTNPSLAQATRRSEDVAAPRNSEFGFKLLK